jgi:hypothetical protein
MHRSLDLLADFTLDVWLVSKYAPQLGGLVLDGRTWERTVAGLMHRPGFTRRQGPGSLTLFGSTSASGVSHEIDGAADSRRGSLIVECKATADGISKADAALFHSKVMDFYQRKVITTSRERWWRILCGTATTPMPTRALALNLSLLICDPDRLPLPVLLRAASQPTADMRLPEHLLQEIVRLGERALCSQQDRWPYNPRAGEIVFKPTHLKEGEIGDLLWLEDELSGCLLDLFKKLRPGALELRAESLIWRARKVA